MLRACVHHEGVCGNGDVVPHVTILALVGGEWSA
jgi:hypothetical protein